MHTQHFQKKFQLYPFFDMKFVDNFIPNKLQSLDDYIKSIFFFFFYLGILIFDLLINEKFFFLFYFIWFRTEIRMGTKF